MLARLANLDRRIVFLGVVVASLLPLLKPLDLPVAVTPEVKRIYDKIDTLPPRSPVLITMDFDPASAAELQPMAKALVYHAMSRNLRVIAASLWAPSVDFMSSVFAETAKETGRENGKDWVVLGYQPGSSALVIRLGQSIKSTFREDASGQKTADMEVLKGVESLKDIKYQVEIQAGEPGIGTWYLYGSLKCKYPLAGGSTSVGAPEWYPYLQSKQLDGLMGGMRAAAEYEKMLGRPGSATPQMDPLSTTSSLVILLVLLGNFIYFVTRGKRKQ